ncbi:MAG: VOC family protein [Dehalococcoidia bacterium]
MAGDGELSVTKLGQVAQPVADLARAVAFYGETLGARHVATFDPPGLAFFDLDGTRIMLDALIAEHAGRGSALYFSVADLDAGVSSLEARGVTLEGEPHMISRDDQGVFGVAGAETWMAFFRDPDGNLLALMSERPPATS